MTRAPRGFTLVELLVTAATAGFALAAVMGVFISQQRSFEASEVVRGVQESLRVAELELERSLRLAGFGVDPRFAFDMRTYACPSVPCRDKIDGPDELVFVSRSPKYRLVPNGMGGCTQALGCPQGNAWDIVAADPSEPSVTLKMRAGDELELGRILYLACPAALRYTMVTVGKTVKVNTNGNQEVILLSAVSGDAYRENAFADACYTAMGATAFLVDRYRYFIRTIDGVPYLMLDNGLDLDDDQHLVNDPDDLIPIARGIEDLQVAYVLQPASEYAAPDSDQNWIVGDQLGIVEELNPTVTAPLYNTRTDDPSRFNLHPANVRSVRITLGARSFRTGQTTSTAGRKFLRAENRNTGVVEGEHQRASITTTVLLRNMLSRAPFIF